MTNPKIKKYSMNIPEEIHERLKIAAIINKTTITNIILVEVEKYLKSDNRIDEMLNQNN